MIENMHPGRAGNLFDQFLDFRIIDPRQFIRVEKIIHFRGVIDEFKAMDVQRPIASGGAAVGDGNGLALALAAPLPAPHIARAEGFVDRLGAGVDEIHDRRIDRAHRFICLHGLAHNSYSRMSDGI